MNLYSYISSGAKLVYEYAVIAPLRRLYFDGPSLNGLGFYAGRLHTDICAELTKIDAFFWHQHPEECANLLDTNFNAFVVGTESVMYVLLILSLFQTVYSLVWYRAMLWSLKSQQKKDTVSEK